MLTSTAGSSLLGGSLGAAEELGLGYPTVERSFASDAERKIHAITLNLARRQLGPVAEG